MIAPRRATIARSVIVAGVTLCVLGMAGVASAAPARPVSTAPNVINDARLFAREGLVLDPDPAPHLRREPLLRGWLPEGAARIGPKGQVMVFGRYGWVLRGPSMLRLSPVGWIGGSEPVSGGLVTRDGGLVVARDAFLGGAGILGFGPDLRPRWTVGSSPAASGPLPGGPLALGPNDLVYAVGGTPSVLDAGTGQVLARLQEPPASLGLPVVAPDGTLRVIGGASGVGDLAISAYAPDGHLIWTTRLGTAATGATGMPVSVGPDGTAYTARPLSRANGEIVSVGSDGVIRWRLRVGREPSRPAIDARGFVWTVTGDGAAIAVDRSGRIAFRRLLGKPGDDASVAAQGAGVLAQYGPGAARLAARPARRTTGGPRLTITPARVSVRVRPRTCVAPAGGRPRTCVFPTTTGGDLRLTTPVDGTTRITVRSAGATGVLYRQGPYRVLAGENRIRLNLAAGGACNAFHPCAAPAGRYIVRARVPIGGGRARVLSARLWVVSSTGRALG